MNLFAKAARGLALVLSLMVLDSQAAIPVDHFLYEGKIDDKPIIMEINKWVDSFYSGRYFFPAEHRSRPIFDATPAGSDNDTMTGFKLIHDAGEGGEKTEQILTITEWTDNGLIAEYRDKSGAPIKVVLSEIERAPSDETMSRASPFMQVLYLNEQQIARASPFMQTLHQHLYDYDRLFYQNAEPIKVKTEEIAGITVSWWQDPVTRFSLFQVESGYPPEQRDKLNASLRLAYWETLRMMSFCYVPPGQTLQTKITLLSPHAMSFILSGKYQCNDDKLPKLKMYPYTLYTAMPQGSSSMNTATLAYEDELRLSDLLWVDKLPVPIKLDDAEYYEYDRDSSGEYELKQQLPGWLIAQFTTLYPAKMTKGAPGECDYTATETWSNDGIYGSYSSKNLNMYWSLTPQGILFKPIRPDNSGVCNDEDWSVLPWNVVNSHPGRIQYLMLP
ncbi:hypothetical protein [Dickeya lacustris]|uniref:Uncharacterized protein n=1 Tax=Dickeya lacustris TaxID=2259638 RepID=A0ABY8G9M0_9GAMM|nr:hypothetical protein [Dickeya lacustris]WFN56640.1 hypothetical protein O1Q98_05015 [Dickeya lacustris]